MEKLINDFTSEFYELSDGEKLYAEALAHLLDKDTKDYMEFLDDADDVQFYVAADPGAPYGDD